MQVKIAAPRIFMHLSTCIGNAQRKVQPGRLEETSAVWYSPCGDQPLAGNNVALVLARLGDRIIESSLKRDGKIVDRWTRELLPGNREMLITQHGYKPDGQPFRNTGIYRRVK